MEAKQLLVADDESQQTDSKARKSFFLFKYLDFRRRYVVSFLSFLGFLNVYTLRVNLSVAIISMEEEYDYYKVKKGLILSAFFYGYIISQIPGGFIASRYGGKKLFGISVMVTSLLAIITPFVAKDYRALIAIRVLQGLAEGAVYPSAHSLWAHWSPAGERTRLSTISFSGSYIGTVLSLSISGVISEKVGWPNIFFSFGTAALLWSIIWIFNVGETPKEDKWISEEEREFIEASTHCNSLSAYSTENERPPWKSILTSKAVWGINFAHFAENWGFYTLLIYFPSYMKERLQATALVSGALSSLPYLIMAIVVQLAGSLADRIRTFKSTTFVRKLFTCSAFCIQAIFTLSAGQASDPYLSIACLTLAVGLGGFAWAGFSVNHLDIGAGWAGLLMGISNTFATIPGIISPILAGSPAEWTTVFGTSAVIYLIGAIFYYFMASGDEQSWARRHVPDDDDDDSD